MAKDMNLTMATAISELAGRMAGPPKAPEATLQQSARAIEEVMFNKSAPEQDIADDSTRPEAYIPDAPSPEKDYIAEAQRLQPTLAQAQEKLALESSIIQQQMAEAKALRHSNPAEYAARLADIQTRQANLDRNVAAYQGLVNDINARVSEQYQADLMRQHRNQTEILQREIPGWGKKAADELHSWLKNKGYTDQQLAGVTDARTVIMAHTAMVAERNKRKTLPTKPGKIDHRQVAEQELRRMNLPRGSERAAAIRIAAMMKRG
jgi:hypothetical protein